MARFSSILSFIFAAAWLSVAGAQATRPVFPQARPQPTANQPQVNPQQQTPPAVNRTVPANQPVAPIKPSPSADPAANNTTPVTPPVVNYRDGLLTVQATNSTLASVLHAIRNKTGIEFEGLEGASDHVALSLGPAPAGEVLTSIFAGSKFDFVAIGRPDDPGIVQRVILTPKSQPGAVAGEQQPQPRPNDNGEGGDPDENPDEQVNVEPQDTAAQPPVPQQPQPQAEQPQQQQAQPKTPEQLLQELQEMRKQQQMQQEGAPPPNPAQVPRKPPR
jgi:hypothetical protein